jgi:uncharacterized LabA/DUF88 family protein
MIPFDTVIFIDGDWLSVAIKRARLPIDYVRFLAFLNRRFGPRDSVHNYISVRSESMGEISPDNLSDLGAQVHRIPLVRSKFSGVDMCLAIDAMALPFQTIKTFVLVSGDGDFSPLLQAMRTKVQRVVLIALPLSGNGLRDSAHEFINLESIATSGADVAVNSDLVQQKSHHDLLTQVIIDKGEHLKSYLHVRKLLVSAIAEICIIDPYLGADFFDLLLCILPEVSVVFVTDEARLPKDCKALMTRSAKEGRSVRVYFSNDFHDRYIRIDNEWWHSGHSIKDLGNRVSQMTRLNAENKMKMSDLLNRTLAKAKEFRP